MSRAGRLVGLVLLAASIDACASIDRPTLAQRFVRQGTPAVDLGGPLPAAMRPIDRRALLRAADAARVPAAAATAGSLEASDPHLRESLARLLAAPSAAQYREVAAAYLRHGIRDRALDYLMRGLAANGADAAVYDDLARLWRDWGQPAEGLGHAHRAVFLSPQSAVAHNTLGTVLYRLGRVADARASFAHALTLDAGAWYALANLCHLNMTSGHTRLAIAQCRKAAALRADARGLD